MKLESIPRPGVLGKVAGALCAVLIALAGLAFIAARSTREATVGADSIESEFAERVKTGTALYTLLVNVALAEERLRVTSPAEVRELDLELTANDAKLAQQMSAALDDPNGAVAAEPSSQAGSAAPIHATCASATGSCGPARVVSRRSLSTPRSTAPPSRCSGTCSVMPTRTTRRPRGSSPT